jgi:peroxiredoxin Q/BCP
MKLARTISTAFTFLTLTLFARADELKVGAPAPDAAGADQSGNIVNFKDVYAKGPTLVYFYPRADTPGCTKQACSIRDDWSELQQKGIQVLGVSGDKPEAQKAFQDKYKLPFTLIADPEGKVAEAFGVPFSKGVAKRESFLIKDGKVAWTMPKASTEGHAKDVLKAYEGLAAK